MNEKESKQSKENVTGWDQDAFWVPTFDRRGALLGIVVLLFIFHFDELIGLDTNATILFGWLPIEMAYQVFQNILQIGFLIILYLNWPSASKTVYDQSSTGKAREE